MSLRIARTLNAARLRPQLTAILRQWRERRRHRAELLHLLTTSPHLVGDIGLTPAQAALEVDKPFWRA